MRVVRDLKKAGPNLVRRHTMSCNEPNSSAKLWDVAEADYHASHKTSGSRIELFRRDRRDYVDQVLHGKSKPPSDEMAFGKYVHALVFEPEKVPGRYVVAPSRGDLDPSIEDPAERIKLVKRNTKAGKEAWEQCVAEAGKRTILMPDFAARAKPLIEALAKHPEASKALRLPGLPEQSAIWTDVETGETMRCRFDKLCPEHSIIVELKTDRDADPTKNGNQWRWYDAGHHRKAAIYLDAAWAIFKRNFTFAYIYVENTDRPRVSYRELQVDDPAVMVGQDEYRETIRQIQRCRSTGVWLEEFEIGAHPHPVPGPVLANHPFTLTGAEEA